MSFSIYFRQKRLINTDPQRRCYNGCHAKSEIVWTGWGLLEGGIKAESIERRIEFWTELNDIAVEGRGALEKREFRYCKE